MVYTADGRRRGKTFRVVRIGSSASSGFRAELGDGGLDEILLYVLGARRREP